jgi:hypothetical protein
VDIDSISKESRWSAADFGGTVALFDGVLDQPTLVE